ncbi:hypothetical protein [Streptomyces sp. NPDC058247]|uniref:hypothetical protein n=1 Tax=Streptomyces sp. NPDC058247 TaxID=3346401 RepID=UPI0036ED67AC
MARDQYSPMPVQPNLPSPQNMPAPPPPEKPPLLSLRTAVILFMAAATGIGIGALTFATTKSYPEAVRNGLIAAGASTVGLHSLIG